MGGFADVSVRKRGSEICAETEADGLERLKDACREGF